MGLWVCLLLGHQRNSVGVINGKRGGVEEGVDVWGCIGIQGCQEGGSIRGDREEVSLAELLKVSDERSCT